MEYWAATLTTTVIVGGATLSLGRWFGSRLAEMREDMDRRFREAGEDMDRRFAEVDRRFGEVDRRFGEVDLRFGAAGRDADRRFRETMGLIQRHAEENREAHAAIGRSIKDSETRIVTVMNQRFEDAGKRVDEMSKRIDDLRSTELIQDLRKHFGSSGG